MAIEFLKEGMDSEATDEADAKVRGIVEGILSDVKDRGDAAVRELSDKFDKWSPESFRLSACQIKELMDSLPEQTIEDIKFAQEQVRNFAQIQKDSMKDVEVETLPGVTLGHKNIPVNSVGCYVPGGRYPMVASAHMSIVTAKVAGVPRVIACTPPNEGGRMPRPSQPCIWPVRMRFTAWAVFRPLRPWRWVRKQSIRAP